LTLLYQKDLKCVKIKENLNNLPPFAPHFAPPFAPPEIRGSCIVFQLNWGFL